MVAAPVIAVVDHPRLRGEYLNPVVIPDLIAGSPPLARGVPVGAIVAEFALRITPACAGSTGNRFLLCIGFQDHPRLRGEYQEPVHMYRSS